MSHRFDFFLQHLILQWVSRSWSTIYFIQRIQNFDNEINKMDSDDVIAFKGETFLEVLLIDYRWIVACFLLLPMSFLYDLFFYVRNAIIFHLNTAPSAHDEKVRKIQRQVCVRFCIGGWN